MRVTNGFRRTALRSRTLTALLTLALLALAGCAAGDPGTDDPDLTVFAAASLRDVFDELERAWEHENPGSHLTVAHDGSNVLAAQIREGAPVDVFASADLARPQALLDSGDARGTPTVFARNRVVLVVPLDSDLVTGAVDLARPGVRIVAAGPGVPITAYADRAIAVVAATQPDPSAFIGAVAANTVSREDNVRAALAKIELGEGDAALVYRTDLLASEGVREIPLPSGPDVVARYAAVATSERSAAVAFIEWLSDPVPQAILARAGFEAGDA